MPLMWNHKISHLLGKNFNLSKLTLKSNLSWFKNKPDQLVMIDNVFKEQQQLGIIERIDDIHTFIKDHPEASFLPHMSVFRLRETPQNVELCFCQICVKKMGPCKIPIAITRQCYKVPVLIIKLLYL